MGSLESKTDDHKMDELISRETITSAGVGGAPLRINIMGGEGGGWGGEISPYIPWLRYF